MNETDRILFAKIDKLDARQRRIEIVLAVVTALTLGGNIWQFIG